MIIPDKGGSARAREIINNPSLQPLAFMRGMTTKGDRFHTMNAFGV